MVALVALFGLTAASATGARQTNDPTCTSGASSVRAHVVDARIVVSTPDASGCTP
jgi:hypothetical protein